jgi:hypothetical protein
MPPTASSARNSLPSWHSGNGRGQSVCGQVPRIARRKLFAGHTCLAWAELFRFGSERFRALEGGRRGRCTGGQTDRILQPFGLPGRAARRLAASSGVSEFSRQRHEAAVPASLVGAPHSGQNFRFGRVCFPFARLNSGLTGRVLAGGRTIRGCEETNAAPVPWPGGRPAALSARPGRWPTAAPDVRHSPDRPSTLRRRRCARHRRPVRRPTIAAPVLVLSCVEPRAPG